MSMTLQIQCLKNYIITQLLAEPQSVVSVVFFLSLIRQANDTTPTAAQIIIIDFIIHHLTIKVVASMDCKDIQIASSYRGAIKWRNLHTRDGRAIWRNEQEPTGR